jgi:hypothetical protein
VAKYWTVWLRRGPGVPVGMTVAFRIKVHTVVLGAYMCVCLVTHALHHDAQHKLKYLEAIQLATAEMAAYSAKSLLPGTLQQSLITLKPHCRRPRRQLGRNIWQITTTLLVVGIYWWVLRNNGFAAREGLGTDQTSINGVDPDFDWYAVSHTLSYMVYRLNLVVASTI